MCTHTRWLLVGLALLGVAHVRVARAVEEVEIEAIAGEPFGVGRISWRVGRAEKGDLDSALDQWQVLEKNGRVLYPAVNVAPIRQVLRNLLDRPERPIVYFLFRGSEPLQITLLAPEAVVRDVRPVSSPAVHRRLMNDWWREFLQSARRNVRQDELPPVVDNYLISMLSRRLGLPNETLIDQIFGQKQIDETLGLFLGTESIRTAMQKETMLRTGNGSAIADQPLPAGVIPPPMPIPKLPDNIEVEPLALHVPRECFYVRFGTFENFQWTRSTLDDWGGDLRNLLSVRGVDFGNTKRIERQLAMKETVLSRIFGPQVVADVAMIGEDTFLREGAAFGLLFQAKNNFLFTNSTNQQRAEALAAEKGSKEETLDIDGHKVSFISTPDNTLRSFYAQDGDFHLVTNSKAIVRRFFEAGQGKGSLGKTEDFRYARTLMPLSRNDTAFAYLSDDFFRNIVGPKYRVEMTRRLQALTDLELIQMAKLAAQAERKPGDTVEQLVRADLLPASFGHRPDGSRPVVAGETYSDSLRGARGTFLPIPDVEIDRITAAEAQAYEEFARFYKSEWERVDPVTAGVRRESTGVPNRERIVVDLHVAPFAKKHYGPLTGVFGEPTKLSLSPINGDAISLEAVLGSGQLLGFGGTPQHVFAGLRDFALPFDIINGTVIPTGVLLGDMLKAYLGAWPTPGILQNLMGTAPVQLDANGFGRGLLGLWFRSFGEFTLMSPQQAVIGEVAPQMRMIEADRPAQLRLNVQDLTQAKLADFINTWAYMRAKKSSAGNVRFLHSLSSQFQLPREDCLAVAQRLIDAKLVCPLNGSYKLNQYDSGLRAWTSTAIVPQRGLAQFRLPEGYQPPPMNWFRGLSLDFTMLENEILAHAEVIAQRKEGAVAPPPANPVSPPATPPQPAKPKGEAIPPPPNGPPVPSK